MLIGNCNVTAELVSLIVAGFLTFLMLYSNPRKTSSYQIIHYGILLSMISIATQLAFFYSQAHTDMFNRELRLFLSLAFLAEYLALLMMLYVYICLLSTRTLHHTKNLQSKVLSFGCTYAIAVFAFAVSGKLPDIIDGLLPLEYYINFYAIFGIITCLICLLSILLNKHSIPKVVNKYALIFIPVDFIMLSVQFMTSNIIFSSLTYVLPFLIYYILFHSNPYDELIGCQNLHSFEARFTDSVSMKRKFLVVYLNFPQLKNVNYAIHNEKVEETAANVCRRIEKLHHMVHIYRFTNDEFAMILYIKDENKIKQFLNNVEMAIIDYMTASSYTINYRIAAIQSNPVVSSTHKLSSMSAYLFNKIANEPGNQCYLATDKDYKEFHEAYKIEQLLLDIRNKNDLDDERVLCYAQPIFSVNNNSFRTAEALMRLSLDGTIIYPDKFIPIAEKNNCIHTLTRIILNKVCKIVAEFEKKYDFDAITINCSSSELSNRNLFDELMAIINSNNIMPEHIILNLQKVLCLMISIWLFTIWKSLMSQVSSSILMTSELDTLTLKE